MRSPSPMSSYSRFPCPQCQHPLKIREEYLGRRVSCKHCSHTFIARAPEETVPAPPPTPPLDPAPKLDDLTTDPTQFWDPEPSLAPVPPPGKVEPFDPDDGDDPFELRLDEDDLFGTETPTVPSAPEIALEEPQGGRDSTR